MLNKAHEIRLIADYTGDIVEHRDALAMVERAETFVAELKILVLKNIGT